MIKIYSTFSHSTLSYNFQAQILYKKGQHKYLIQNFVIPTNGVCTLLNNGAIKYSILPIWELTSYMRTLVKLLVTILVRFPGFVSIVISSSQLYDFMLGGYVILETGGYVTLLETAQGFVSLNK